MNTIVSWMKIVRFGGSRNIRFDHYVTSWDFTEGSAVFPMRGKTFSH